MQRPEEPISVVSKATTLSTIPTLLQIWQRLLQVPSVSPDDNFFELGGDSALAIQLFDQIDEIYGRALPPVMIYHVQTISSLAVLIEQQSTPELSPLILLKEGSTARPLYIAPGLGGGPAEFFQLVKYIQAPNPIYGLQPKGIEGLDDPCERIEDMAEFYLQALLRFQARGPYLLAGYSLGGLVALEVARALVSRGQEVLLLALIDSYPYINALMPMQFLRLLAQRAKRRISTFGQPPRTDIRLGGLSSSEAIPSFAPAFERVRDAAYRALKRYKPDPYAKPVKFIRAADVTEFPADPASIWSHLLLNLQVETVPGDHLGMLTTHYEELASVLNRHLNEAEKLL
jgi:acetoacetyl-CoA synthetase